MIKFTNYDARVISSAERSVARKLPEKVTSVEVTHDGGRLGIYINGEEYFYECEGTRDCAVTIDDK